METKEIIDLIDQHLQEVNTNEEECTKRIMEILDFLNYNLGFTKLSEEEKKDFIQSMEGYPLTDGMRKTLESCETEERKNHYIDMWAISHYMRQCAWTDYLSGKTDKKPPI